MDIKDMFFPEVKMISNFKAADGRGAFVKIYNNIEYARLGLKTGFEEIFYSRSQKNVIRGMHFQIPPHEHVKLVHVMRGKIRDVIVDIRRGSSTYGKVMDVILSDEEAKALYIPVGFAHGFVSLSEDTIVMYCVTGGYSKEHDLGIRWDSIEYDWKIRTPIVSERDSNFPLLCEYETPFEVER